MEKRQDTDAFSFCSEHHTKILLKKPNDSDIERSLLQKIKYPETVFLNGNIVLNDGLNNNSGGILYAENIKLLPPNKKNSFYNVLGIKKRLLEISIIYAEDGDLDIKTAFDTSNIYIFENDDTHKKIGEVVDISDTASVWIELYDSDTSLGISDNILFSSSDTYPTPIDVNKREATISEIKEVDYIDIPKFKPIILQSKLDSSDNPILDISGGGIKVNDISSNNAKINILETNELYIEKFNTATFDFEYNDGNQITGITDISAENMEVDNLILNGELELTGTMTYITSNNLRIADNIVHLNAKKSDVTTSDIDGGILINRGTDVSNVFMGWKKSAKTFIFGKTDSSGSTDTISDISICTIQADISGTIKTTRQEKITELPKLSRVGNLIGGSLGKGFGKIDISSNISTTTKISAQMIESIGTGGTYGLSGEVITTTQNYIKKLPNLTEVGSLTDGSLNNGFGPIYLGDAVGIPAKSKIIAKLIEATGTGGTSGLIGILSTPKQNNITKLPNLTKVGDLSGGTIIEGFGPIYLGDEGGVSTKSKIIAKLIEATGTGGTRGLSGEVITITQNYITELPKLNTVGVLSKGSIDCSLNKGFGPINLGITDTLNSVITANINSDVNVSNYNENIDISGGIVSKYISTNSVLLTGTLDLSNGNGLKLDDNIIKFKTNDVGWKSISMSFLGDIISNITNELYNTPSIVQNLMVVGPTTENDIKLDISWNEPVFSNILHDTETISSDLLTYKIELSKDPLFENIDVSHNVHNVPNVPNVNFTLNANNFPGIRCTGYYVRIQAKNGDDGNWGEYNVFQDTPGYPKMVSAGDNCYDYETKEKWIALPDYYKERIETIMFFKSTTIPENALNQDVFENDLPTPDEGNFTIEISGNVTDISENAFSGLSTLTKVIFNASTTPLKIGHSVFKDCTDLSFVDIYRKWLPNDLSNYDDIFGLSYDTSGTPLTLTYNGEIDSSFSLVGDISASRLFTNRNDTDISNGVIINLHENDPFITPLTTHPYSLTSPKIDFNWKSPSLYDFTSPPYHKFTPCGADRPDGRFGPTILQCRTAYAPAWAQNPKYFMVQDQGVQEWVVPKTGKYFIKAAGAQGGNTSNGGRGGYGALIAGEVVLQIGSRLKIAVGQMPEEAHNSGGGGGGTFVVHHATLEPIMVAGGGSGGSYYPGRSDGQDGRVEESGGNNSTSNASGGVDGNGGESNPTRNAPYNGTSYGGGGAGLRSNGQHSSDSVNAARGGESLAGGAPNGGENYDGSDGGFGGGGGAGSYGSGGGGGYSGGGGGETNGEVGGGGGSFNAASIRRELSNTETGSGYVEITLIQ